MSPMIEQGSVAVGVDGSSHSDRALDWAILEAEAERRPLTILHAAGSPAIRSVGSLDADARSRLRITGRRVTDAALGYVVKHSPDLQVRVVMRLGDPEALLLDASRTASILVLGSRGRGALTSLLLGSVSVAVAESAHCPVVVVRPAAEHDADRIVVGIDGSEISMSAVDFAFSQASLWERPLTVLHVQSDPTEGFYPADGMLMDSDTLAQLLTAETLAGFREKHTDVDLTVEFARGEPAPMLVRASAHASMIVVGSRGRSTTKALLMGSTSRSVVERAFCTVVVAR